MTNTLTEAAQTSREMVAAHEILSELRVVLGRAFLAYMREKNINVIMYEQYDTLMGRDERAEDYTPYGFILNDGAGMSVIAYNEKQPFAVKVHTLLHELIHHVSENYRNSSREAEQRTDEAARFIYSNSLFCIFEADRGESL